MSGVYISFFYVALGPKVISKDITVESIEELAEVLRRPPVIWDNLHANDYDQKRVFLGPYAGRSPQLISRLRGVLTNPNCEYGTNFVAIHTLAQWYEIFLITLFVLFLYIHITFMFMLITCTGVDAVWMLRRK